MLISVFTQDFVKDIARAKRWKGLRQDSGNPFVYAPRAKAVYESLGIDYKEKTIIFSDALKTDKVLRLKTQCDELGFPCETSSVGDLNDDVNGGTSGAFGIGTFFTNDFRSASSGGKQESKALNMVIKLNSIDGKPTVKISDDIDKVRTSLQPSCTTLRRDSEHRRSRNCEIRKAGVRDHDRLRKERHRG